VLRFENQESGNRCLENSLFNLHQSASQKYKVLVDKKLIELLGQRDYFITFLIFTSIERYDVLVLQRRKERLVDKIDMLKDILMISNKMITFIEASTPLQVDRKIFY
jgi:hypothetical protein